jgi:4-hydroxybenzoate polyprenyltransferase
MVTFSYAARLERLVLFSQTLFGLPWLIAAVMLLCSGHKLHVTPQAFAAILVAFVSARIAGMCFNRLIDRHIDAKNPRTANRSLPRGEVSSGFTLCQALLFSAFFLSASWVLSKACFWVALFALMLIVLYSYTKRISALCHFVLGTIHALVPMAVWAAFAQEVTFVPVTISAALLCQIAASDIIYACQDIEFDRKHDLKSVPAALGATKALYLAKLFHLAAFCFLVLLSLLTDSLPLLFGACSVGAIYIFAYRKASYETSFTMANRLSGITYLFFVLWHVL